MINILLGIGGTGAKVVESALVLLAAGIGPEKVHVGLIDQDGSNGNVIRTQTLLADLAGFRRDWRRTGVANAIDWDHDGRPDFGALDIELLFDEDEKALWCPSQTQASLRTIVGENLSPEQRDLFDLLFMRGDQEQDLPLDKGYRGRAHVGATAMLAAILDENDNKLRARLIELMQAADREPVNVFLVGSAFGGTGASGFPTLARALRKWTTSGDFKNKGKVSIGGMLMLPYFSFKEPPEGSLAVVTPDEILPKTRLALEYYENLFQHEDVFDRFYVAGWEDFFSLGYHVPGGVGQANPAMLPELLAATATIDFFTRDNMEAAREKEEANATGVPVMVSAREDKAVKWRDMPIPTHQVEARLGQMLRFCVYWRYVAEPNLHKASTFGGIGDNWTQKLVNGVKPADSTGELNSLNKLVDDVLLWAATIEATGKAFWKNGPWDLTRLHNPQHQPDPTRPIALLKAPTPEVVFKSIDHLIRDDHGHYLTGVAHTMHDELTRGRSQFHGDHKGIGRAVAAVYASSRLR